MPALSKFQNISGKPYINHLFYGATTIASILFARAFVNIVKKGGKISSFPTQI